MAIAGRQCITFETTYLSDFERVSSPGNAGRDQRQVRQVVDELTQKIPGSQPTCSLPRCATVANGIILIASIGLRMRQATGLSCVYPFVLVSQAHVQDVQRVSARDSYTGCVYIFRLIVFLSFRNDAFHKSYPVTHLSP
jgi:hypothetical protein